MVRVYATRLTANVVDYLIGRNRPDEVLVTDAVSAQEFLPDEEISIAAAVKGALPNPATVVGAHGPE